MRRHIGAALAVLLAVLAGACAQDDAPAEATRDANGCPVEGASFEGMYAQDEVRLYFQCSWPAIEQFIHAANEEAGMDVVVPTVYYVDYGDTVEVPCSGGDADDMAYFYCPTDQTIYVGAMAIWEEYDPNGPKDMGDMALPASVAHELGHHYQERAGVSPDYEAVDENGELFEVIAAENQADCVAGVVVRWFNQQGLLEFEDDIVDTERMIHSIAEHEGEGRSHGTQEERVDSFNLGFTDGFRACNNLYEPIYFG